MSKAVDWGLIHGAGEIVCTCDGPGCGIEERVEFENGPDYRQAQYQIESQKWFSKKIGDVWYDVCSRKCYEAFLKRHGL